MMYKKAIRDKVRVITPLGKLSVEQLYDLKLTQLRDVVVDLRNASMKNQSLDDLDFLDKPVVTEETQFLFELVKDIYVTKKAEQDALKNEASVKEHNQKIMALISQKEESELANKSLDDLKSMLK